MPLLNYRSAVEASFSQSQLLSAMHDEMRRWIARNVVTFVAWAGFIGAVGADVLHSCIRGSYRGIRSKVTMLNLVD